MPPLFAPVSTPITGLRKHSIRDRFLDLCFTATSKNLIGFLSVAGPMSELEILQVAWMSTLGHGDNMIDARRKRMRVLHPKFHRLAADSAHGLGCIYLLFVPLKGQAVGTVFVGPVSLPCRFPSPLNLHATRIAHYFGS